MSDESEPIKLVGFAPDLDITTPGILLDDPANNFVPTINGVGPPKGLVSAGFPALAASSRGAAVIRKIDDSTRFFAGTQTKLYEGANLTWTDVSAGGGSYTGGAENLWRFAQFGNDTIATNRTDPVQVSTSSGAFSNLGGSPPKASIVETCQGFVLLFDYNDGVNDYGDGWWCSALRNDASWSPSIATQAANNRLLDSPGKINAARRLGDIMVAYKQRSMYLGFYDGPPVIWRWQLLPGEQGALSQEAVIPIIIDGVPCHIFCGFDGFYLFDGSRPRFIGNPLKKWFNSKTSAQFRYRIKAMHDVLNQTIYFYLVDSSGNLTFSAPYNYRSDRWGNMASIAQVVAAVEYISAGTTYDGLGSLYSTWDSLPTNISYDSPFWTSGAPLPAIFGTDNILKTYTSTPGASGFTCGYTGDNGSYRTLQRIRPRFNTKPSGIFSGTVRYTDTIGDQSPATIATSNLNKGKMDVLKSSKWFSPQFSCASGDYEITGYVPEFVEDGEE